MPLDTDSRTAALTHASTGWPRLASAVSFILVRMKEPICEKILNAAVFIFALGIVSHFALQLQAQAQLISLHSSKHHMQARWIHKVSLIESPIECSKLTTFERYYPRMQKKKKKKKKMRSSLVTCDGENCCPRLSSQASPELETSKAVKLLYARAPSVWCEYWLMADDI